MSMAQEGTIKKLDLEERGHLSSGGSLSETPYKTEAPVIVEGELLTETPQRAETVVITNE